MSVSNDLSAFRDIGRISDYALEPLRWAVSKGIMAGVETDLLSPEQNITRAQLSVMLSQWSKVVEG